MKATINGVLYQSDTDYDNFRRELSNMLRNKGWSFLDSYMLSNIWLQWCTRNKTSECEITYKTTLRIK